jgi:hypothetical protein
MDRTVWSRFQTRGWGVIIAAVLGAVLVSAGLITLSRAGSLDAPVVLTDMTPMEPLLHPLPCTYESRYLSGFGLDDAFTVFFEDRSGGEPYPIAYVSTTSGPTGFGTVVTQTNIADTHFVVKDWPVTVSDTTYAYRAWGAVGNVPEHRFYVSNNLVTWTLSSTFTIQNATSFTDAKGFVYYGFHDVIQLNGRYYAFAESNQSQTMIVSSTTGTDDWVAFASVGGPGAEDGPLQLPTGVVNGWTPSGSFVDLGGEGYAKVHVDPRDSYFYLALNAAAQSSLPPAELEAAFIAPANWTWHDGSTGPASSPILSETVEHDLRECWVVPQPSTDGDWLVIYDAAYNLLPIGKALGYATMATHREYMWTLSRAAMLGYGSGIDPVRGALDMRSCCDCR